MKIHNMSFYLFLIYMFLILTTTIVQASEDNTHIPAKDLVRANATYNANHTVTLIGELIKQDDPWLEGIHILLNDKHLIYIPKQEISLNKMMFSYTFPVKHSNQLVIHNIEINYEINFEVEYPDAWLDPLLMRVYDPKYEFNVESAAKKKTIASIREKEKRYAAKYKGSPFKSNPQAKAPYKTGTLQPGLLTDGLNRTNFYRYLANLPDDLVLNNQLNTNAQYGAVLLNKLGYLSHYPPKPRDMTQAFYNQAYEATSSSNLCQCYEDLASSVDLYMDDTDSSNISRVGHRRWILSAQLKNIGFGLSDNFSAMKVIDGSRETMQVIKWDHLSWPATGYMPIQYFNAPTAWSVSLNPEVYTNLDPKKITVTVVNIKTKKVWKLNPTMNKYTISGNYMNVDEISYGNAQAVIFRPSLPNGIKHGDIFDVTVNGLHTVDGVKKNITYRVHFFK